MIYVVIVLVVGLAYYVVRNFTLLRKIWRLEKEVDGWLGQEKEKMERQAKVEAKEIIDEAKLVNEEVRAGFAKKAEEAATQMGEELEKQVVAIAGQTKLEVERDYDQVRKELERYRKEQLSQIDKEMKKRALEALSRVLGEGFDKKTHQKLVMGALNNAKRKGLL